MVRKKELKQKKRALFLSRAILEKELIEAERKQQTLKDIKKLYNEGFVITCATTFTPLNTSSSKSIMERRLRKMAIRHTDKNKLLKNIRIKKVQHPNRNIKTYILVTKRRK